LMQKMNDLRTPALVVYKHKVEANCERMLKLAKDHGVTLKPHFKTTKCLEVAIMQTGGTKCGMEVSTLVEADLLAENGFENVIYAYPISPHKTPKCAELSEKMKSFVVFVDNVAALKALEQWKLKDNKNWQVLVEVDTGAGRSGVQIESLDAVSLIKEVVKCGNVTFSGLYSHCGHSYKCKNAEEIKEVGKMATNKMLTLVDELKKQGITCPSYGIGSTPSCSKPAPEMSKLTEWHPGNYVLYDLMQVKIGSCEIDDIASFVLTRVIGHYTKGEDVFLIIDCGWTAISLHGVKDSEETSGYGLIVDHPELKLAHMSQEHGIVKSKDSTKPLDLSRYPVDSFLRIYPYHSCATCAMHPVFYVADQNDNIIDHWRPVKGW
uniref:D-serine dehydratase n=2 Tax=Ciona intestinalis TaxID=7719 RepID=F6PLX2_CIOIN